MKRPTTKSYSGRQVDVEVLQHVDKMLAKQRVYPEFHSSQRIVSGIEKAVQRYAKLFLTALESIKLDQTIGSDLLKNIRLGLVSNLSSLGLLYAEADNNAKDAIAKDDADTDTFGDIPDDERIVETELVDMNLDYTTATVKIHVKITTAAGDDFTFVIPVSSGLTT